MLKRGVINTGKVSDAIAEIEEQLEEAEAEIKQLKYENEALADEAYEAREVMKFYDWVSNAYPELVCIAEARYKAVKDVERKI